MIKGKKILITFLWRIWKILFHLISIILETLPSFIIKYTNHEKPNDNMEIKQKDAKIMKMTFY